MKFTLAVALLISNASAQSIFSQFENEMDLADDYMEDSLTLLDDPVETRKFTIEDNIVSYMGCYKDSKYNRDLHYQISKNSSPKECLKKAVEQGFLYAGLQVGRECWADHYRPSGPGKRPEYECNKVCEKDQSFSCGSYFRNSVWKIESKEGIEDDKWLEGVHEKVIDGAIKIEEKVDDVVSDKIKNLEDWLFGKEHSKPVVNHHELPVDDKKLVMVKNSVRFGGKPFHADLPTFRDIIPNNEWRVSQIQFTHGDVIDSLQMAMVNDKTGEIKQFKKHGRGGGRKAVINIPQDDCITGVTVWNSAYVEKLQFHFKSGKATKVFGKRNNEKNHVQAKDGECLIGMWGNYGWYIDSLGFTSAKQSVKAKIDTTNVCGKNEAKNAFGPGRCAKHSECNGKRTCTASGWCHGTSGCVVKEPVVIVKRPSAESCRVTETHNWLGRGRCQLDSHCKGNRTCSHRSSWCIGTSGCQGSNNF